MINYRENNEHWKLHQQLNAISRCNILKQQCCLLVVAYSRESRNDANNKKILGLFTPWFYIKMLEQKEEGIIIPALSNIFGCNWLTLKGNVV